jgi:hypothetical protein
VDYKPYRRGRAARPWGEPDAAGPLPGLRPDDYLIVATGRLLHAPTLAELAEIAECAIAAGDRIESLRARTAGGSRLFSPEESQGFSRLLASRLD